MALAGCANFYCKIDIESATITRIPNKSDL